MVTVQKIKPTIGSEFESARRYYATISSLNDLGLTRTEVSLLAFMATKGNISVPANKSLFCETYGHSKSSVNNIIHQLKRKGLLKKTSGKISILKSIDIDFSNTIVLQITLNAETRE